LRLPGESLTSTNLSYSTYVASLKGTYTYWTVGNFVGTDVNSGKVVYGTTNTNYTITCHGHSGRGGGCTYTYTTDNGTIVVYFTVADQTGTSVTCVPSTIVSGASTDCTATVRDLGNTSAQPSGNVSFVGPYGSTAGLSNGGNCTLISAACTVAYTAPDEQLGTVAITASFVGNSHYYASSGRTSVYVSSSDSGGGGSFSTVSFRESGLPNGSDWSVTFGGLSLTSTTPVLPFVVQNGTYAFTVPEVAGFTVSPRNGNITVSGTDVRMDVTFAPVSYAVTFAANGLPLGRAWSVAVDGVKVRTTSSSITLNETNGSHTYLIAGPLGYRVTGLSPSGNFTIDGAPSSLPLSFVRGPTFAVVISETGYLRHGTWCVILGTVACSSTSVLQFANLTPAVYGYATVPMPGWLISAKMGAVSLPASGNLTISTHSLRIALHYVYPYVVTFFETGLPTGTDWSVTVAGVVQYSTNSTITFELGNGTHWYRIGAIVGFLHSSTPNPVRVVGGPAIVSVTFRP
jgi:hypothetical protein